MGTFFKNDNIPRLNNQQKANCDGLLTLQECWLALKGFRKNKSPGTDGLTAEFYCSFWNLLGEPLVDSLNHAFAKRELSISQQRGIIRLLTPPPKKRPIVFEELETNIPTKCGLQNRNKGPTDTRKKGTTFDHKQCSNRLLGGRFIGENIRQIADVLHFTLDQKTCLALLFSLTLRKHSTVWKGSLGQSPGNVEFRGKF